VSHDDERQAKEEVMSRVLPNDILASGSCVVTLKVVRAMDKGDVKREKLYSFPLSFSGVGSLSLAALPHELQMIGGQILNKIESWEGRASKRTAAQNLELDALNL
jgi:hypothetical protein